MLTWPGGMLTNQGTLSFLVIEFSPSLVVFGPGGGAVGGGRSCLYSCLWPLSGALLLDLVPNSLVRGENPPFLRLLGSVQGLLSQDHKHGLVELSLLKRDFSCLCSRKGVMQTESRCQFIRQQTISAKAVTPGKSSEEITHVATRDCGVIGWLMTVFSVTPKAMLIFSPTPLSKHAR